MTSRRAVDDGGTPITPGKLREEPLTLPVLVEGKNSMASRKASNDPRRAPLSVRLARNITPDPVTGCHNWTAPVDNGGYGRIAAGDGTTRRLMAHRAAYELAHGPVPAGLEVDHLCRNRRCCNLAHLEAVTPAENKRRVVNGLGPVNAAKTHCAHGHEFTAENTVSYQPGKRRCRTCDRARKRVGYVPPSRATPQTNEVMS